MRCITFGCYTNMDVEFRIMIEIIGYFPDSTVRRVFNCVLDAIEYRDDLDAQYVKVDWITL